MKKIIALLLCVAFVLSVVPYDAIAAENTKSVSDAVVYLNGANGNDSNDGKTAAKAVKTLAKAVEVANTFTNAENVTVVVTGKTDLADKQHYILPANNAKIIVTSKYNGTDYRGSGACLTTFSKDVSCIYFNGDFAFEYVTINQSAKNAIFVMQYNSLKIGGGVTVNAVDPTASSGYPILLVGCNMSYDKAATATSFTNDITIEVNSGTWAYIRGGDRDSTSTFDAKMTVNINGGKFLCPVTSATGHYTSGNVNSATGKSSYGPNTKIVMNLNGGEMNSFAGCSYVATGSNHVNYADITVNINDGFKLTNKFVAVQSTNATFNGRLTVNIYGGDFSEVVESKLANLTEEKGGTGVVTVNYDPNDKVSAAAYKILKDKCLDDSDVSYGVIKADADPVVFVKDGGTGDGSSPHSARATLVEAYSSLDLSKNCTVVICGPCTQSVNFDTFAEFDGNVTITSVYGGVDYRVTADAEYVINKGYRFVLYGATSFDDITVRLKNDYWFLIAQCNRLYIGEGFEAVLEGNTDGSTFAKALSILGGYQNDAGAAADNLNCSYPTDITVLSGSKWVISTYNRQVASGNHSGKATVVIGGDAEVTSLYYTSVNKPGVLCGDVEITVKDNATVQALLASPNSGAAITTKSLTVNWWGGNIASVSLAGSATNAAVITNGAALNYTAEAAEKPSFSNVSSAFNSSSLVTPPAEVEPDDGITAYGNCGASGDNLTWTLYDNGALEISGAGAMRSYTEQTVPWNAYCSDITSVTVASGVTGIGDYAFFNCGAVAKITVPDSVTSFGVGAFCANTVIISSHAAAAKQYAMANGYKFVPSDLKLNSASLTLYNNLAVNYKVKKADFDAAGYTKPYLKIVMDGRTTVITDYTVSDNMYVFTFRNIAPYLMNEEMQATLYGSLNGTEYEADTITYSIAMYCYRQLAKSTDSKFCTFIVDLLNYGAESQRYVDYKLDSLANADLTEAQAALGTTAEPNVTDALAFIGDEGEAAVWRSASIELRDNISVRLKFTATDVSGVFVKVEMHGNEYRITKITTDANGRYVAKFEAFNATHLRDEIRATVCDADGNAISNTLVYSVETYVARSLENEKLGAFVKAMMKYGDSAYALNKAINEPSDAPVDDGIVSGSGYFLKLNSLTLAGETFGTIHGELAAMSEIDGDLDSIWYLDRQKDGTYLIRSAVCGYYLSVKNNATTDGAAIALYMSTANHGQHWRAIVTDNGYLLQCVETGGYLGSAHQVASKASAPVWTLQHAVTADTELPRVLPLKGAINAPASCPEIIKYNGVYYNINMTGGMKIKSSTDLITWTNVTTVFDEKPSWIMDELGYDSIWAPGYYVVGGKLRIYYSVSSSGSRNSLIGLVDCATPTSGFVDRGMVIRSYKESPNTTPYNCIDPNVFTDTDGKVYLVWGSYADGIYMQRIDPDTGKLCDAPQYRLADASFGMEAPYLIKRGDYYYLFVAMGSLNKTADYYWAVGRSTSITGPYYDKNGNPMLNSSSDTLAPLTEWKDGVQGVGHAQPFYDADADRWYMVSESWEYRTEEETSSIKLHISTIVWNEAGWPVTALSTDLLNEIAEK